MSDSSADAGVNPFLDAVLNTHDPAPGTVRSPVSVGGRERAEAAADPFGVAEDTESPQKRPTGTRRRRTPSAGFTSAVDKPKPVAKAVPAIARPVPAADAPPRPKRAAAASALPTDELRRLEERAWARLAVEGPVLPSRLSPSRAKDFKQCPQLFFYKTLLKLPTPNTIATTRGTLAHHALERIFDHPAGERTPELAVPYVRAAWAMMTDPLKQRSGVVADTPEFALRAANGQFRDLIEGGSDKEARALASAADYRGLVMEDGVEEELLSSAEQMVRNWFGMERANNFDPTRVVLPDGKELDGRELHVEGKVRGAVFHGFIDRLDSWPASGGGQNYAISDYKGLACTTPLRTPAGWTTMGEVEVGDLLFGADGRPTRVVAKSQVHHRPCYRVVFDDGSDIVADNVHLWQITAGYGHRFEVVTTEALRELVVSGNRVSIPNAAALDLPGTVADDLVTAAARGDRAAFLRILLCDAETRADLVAALVGSGQLRAERATLQLDERGAVRDLIEELACSLGWTITAWGEIRMPVDGGRLERRVTAVEPVESVPTQCVKVDAPDHLYLAGRQMVPTHNTGKLPGEGKRYSPKMMAQIRDDAFFAMRAYAVLTRVQFGIVPRALRLVFLKTGNREEGILEQPVTGALLARTEAELVKVWREIQQAGKSGVWETRTGPLCGWCSFLDLCPAFAAEPLAPDALPGEVDASSALPV